MEHVRYVDFLVISGLLLYHIAFCICLRPAWFPQCLSMRYGKQNMRSGMRSCVHIRRNVKAEIASIFILGTKDLFIRKYKIVTWFCFLSIIAVSSPLVLAFASG